ncbi:MAG: HAMP domain-containing sensor histidine kinase [Bacteroidota bacterium]|jgi:signal transduction histidine kinase
MITSSDFTYFASPERDGIDTIQHLALKLEAVPLLRPMLEAFPTLAVVLGRHRQILMYNGLFDEAIPHSDDDLLLGMRLGNSVGCEIAASSPSGCGTGKECRMCGAVLAMLEAQAGKNAVQECSIAVRDQDGLHTLEFRVVAIPMNLADENVTILSLVDISNENRRKALERVFFHDILNTASGVRSVADLLRILNGEEREELVDDLDGLSNQLIEEIRSQRDILSAEHGDLHADFQALSSTDILSHVLALYRFHYLSKDRQFQAVNNAEGQIFESEPTIISRVLGNLAKNALEASAPGDSVTVRCDLIDDDSICFSVHNPAVMPQDVQLQIFKRSFSTKGSGRGLGTYSARLLTERYLGGKIAFHSADGDGTTFFVTLPCIPKNLPERKTA